MKVFYRFVPFLLASIFISPHASAKPVAFVVDELGRDNVSFTSDAPIDRPEILKQKLAEKVIVSVDAYANVKKL